MIKIIFSLRDIELYGNKEKFHKDYQILNSSGYIRPSRNKFTDEDEEIELTIEQAFNYGLLEKGI